MESLNEPCMAHVGKTHYAEHLCAFVFCELGIHSSVVRVHGDDSAVVANQAGADYSISQNMGAFLLKWSIIF